MTLNSLDKALNENILLNITIGRTLLRNEEKYLLTIKDDVNKRRDAFIIECTEKQSWFEE